jgi:hypothetical protein
VRYISCYAAAIGFSLAVASSGICGDASELRLKDDFELSDFAPEGGLYYKKNFEQGAGSVEFQSRDVREGKGALSLAIEALCPENDGDCSERAEVWERKKVLARYHAPVWYAFSMKLLEPIPADDHRYLLAQWKREMTSEAEKPYSPFMALRLDKGKLVVTVETDEVEATEIGTPERPLGCKPGETLVNNRPHERQTRALVAWEAAMDTSTWRFYNGCTRAIGVTHASGWMDFVFHIRTGPTGGGLIEIIANGQRVATVAGHIGHEGKGLGDKQYFKFGPYRSGHDGRWTVLYDRFRRGPSCSDVAPEGICASLASAGQ